MILKAYNFLIYTIYQKSITADIHKNDPPKVKTAWGVAWLQIMLVLLVFFMVAILADFNLRKNKLILFSIIIAIGIYNYRLCVKGDYLDRIKAKFEYSNWDTPKNRKLAMIWVAFYFALFIVTIGLSSYLKFR